MEIIKIIRKVIKDVFDPNDERSIIRSYGGADDVEGLEMNMGDDFEAYLAARADIRAEEGDDEWIELGGFEDERSFKSALRKP